MASSIASTLGIGSGLDTAKLISDLTTAAKAPKEAAIKAREDLNTARVSALGKVTSGIDAFASALSSLIAGGSLFTQPSSSDSNVVGVTAIAGSRLGSLSAQLEVKSLATAQVISSGAAVSDPNAAIGQGTLSLTTSTGTVAITVGPNNDSLVGLAKSINAAAANVSASVVKDGGNYRLVVKGATGAGETFTLARSAADPDGTGSDDPAGLGRFLYSGTDGAAGTGFTRTQQAKDAELVLDGLPLTRDSNTIKDLIPGVTISLKNAAPGTKIAIGSVRPTDAIKSAVGDFVAAYNELKTTIDGVAKADPNAAAVDVPLRGESSVRELQRQLAKIVSTKLATDGSYQTLADIGVKTNRDGTLAVDDAKLTASLSADPDSVEALFNPTQSSSNPLVSITSAMGKTKPGTFNLTDLVKGPPPSGKINGVDALVAGNTLIGSAGTAAAGLSFTVGGDLASATITVDAGLGGALQAIRDSLRATGGPLASTSTRLTNEQKQIADDRTSMESRSTAYSDQLNRSFTAMDTRVAAIKATQSYLEQQIKVWTNGNN